MLDNTELIKIKVGLILKSDDTISIDENGNPTHSAEFNQKIYDKEELFRSKLILQINQSIGLHNWIIRFGEMYKNKEKYVTDIYADNNDEYNLILNILQQKIPEIDLMPTYKGSVDLYVETLH